MLTIASQSIIDDRREDKADRRENLRFLREQTSTDNIRRVTLFNIDLAGQNLAGLELESGQMLGANLNSADLSGTSISNSNLLKARFAGADLSGFRLERVNVQFADFRRVNLTNASFEDAAVDQADFTGATYRVQPSRFHRWIRRRY